MSEPQDPRITLGLVALGIVQLGVVLWSSAGAAFRVFYVAVVATPNTAAMVAVAVGLGGLYLAAALAPLVGVFALRWRLPIRLGLVLAPSVVGLVVSLVSVALHLDEGRGRDAESPPPNCRPSTLDPSLRLRPCETTRRDGGDPFAGTCPDGFVCREPVGRTGPPACYVGCYHDCMCPAPARCVNAACSWPGDPLP